MKHFFTILFLMCMVWQSYAQDTIPLLVPGAINVQSNSFYPYAIIEYDSTLQSNFYSSISGFDSVATVSGIYKIKKTFSILGNRDWRLANFYTIQFSDTSATDSLISFLHNSDQIIIAEKIPVYSCDATPTDLLYASGYQWYLDKIEAEDAWDFTTGSKSVQIAVADNGVMIDHIDLISEIWINQGEIPNTIIINDTNGDGIVDANELLAHYSSTSLRSLLDSALCDSIDSDNNGYIDDIFGWNSYYGHNKPHLTLSSDTISHGTCVAGIAGAETSLTSANGMASVGWNCTIIPINMADTSGSFYNTSINPAYCIHDGIEYAIASDADIINMSIGTSVYSATMDSLMSVAYSMDKILVASAGNDNSSFHQYPAGYDHVITVGASTAADTKRSDSNYGNYADKWVDLMAPGDSIFTSSYDFQDGLLNQYVDFSATSAAAPIVSGVAGLMRSICPECNYETIKYCLLNSCDSMPNDSLYNTNPDSSLLGYGRVNAYKAVECITNITPLAEFEAGSEFICPGSSVQFFNMSVGVIHSWSWSATGSVQIDTTDIPNPVITFPDSVGVSYTIYLTVTNDSINGPDSTSTISHTYTVGADISIAYSSADTICNGNLGYIFVDFDNATLPATLFYHDDNGNNFVEDSISGAISAINVPVDNNSQTWLYIDSVYTADSCLIPAYDSVLIVSQDCGCTPNFNNNWVSDGLDLQFKSTPTNSVQGFSTIPYYNSGNIPASISDTEGNLLFYTNGVKVFDNTHSIMVNGDSLNGSISASQNAIILPKPQDEGKYYIFTVKTGNFPASAAMNNFNYHIVDMNQGNNGEVISKNNVISTQSPVSERLTWVKHGTDENTYWVITHSQSQNSYYVLNVSPAGISQPTKYDVGYYLGTLPGDYVPVKGTIRANQQGTLIATTFNYSNVVNGVYYDKRLDLLSFNNQTGAIAFLDSVSQERAHYSEFSPDGNYLYVSSKYHFPIQNKKISRYDVSGSSPSLSNITLIGTESGYYTYLQLTPDKKRIVTYDRYTPDEVDVVVNPNDLNPILATGFHQIPSGYYLSGAFPQFVPEDFDGITLSASIDPACDCSSQVTINPQYGCNPYTFLWSNTSLTDSTAVLCPGYYSVTVVDDCGCMDSISFNVPQVTPEIIGFDTIRPCVGLSTGIIILYVEGLGPFEYSWSNGATTKDIYGLEAGTYSVTVTNPAFGCTDTATIVLNNLPQNITITDYIQEVTCTGICNGYIQLSVSGSPSPYSYLWNTGDTTNSIYSLCPGDYYVTVFDGNDCPIEETYKIHGPDHFYQLSYTDSICGCYGTAQVTDSLNIYEVTWFDNSVAMSIDSLCPDSIYTLYIEDTVTNCSFTDTFSITFADIEIPASFQSTDYCGCVNDLDLYPDSIFWPYNYDWSTGDTTQNLDSVCPGYYWVTITSQDYELCSDTAYYFLEDTSSLYLLFTVLDPPTCPTLLDGTVEFLLKDSSTYNYLPNYPYTYSFTNFNNILIEDTVTQQMLFPGSISNIPSGSFYLSAIDSNGCFEDTTVIIEAFHNPYYSIVSTSPASCDSACDGELEFILYDFSQGPYTLHYGSTYYVSTSPNDVINNLCPDAYSNVIVDDNGCTIPWEFEIEAEEFYLEAEIISPSCNQYSSNGSISITMTTAQSPYTYNWNTGATTSSITFDTLGTYMVTVTGISNCSINDTFLIDTVSVLDLALVPEHPTCYNIDNGSIEAVVSNGMPPYSYLWSNSETTESISGLGTGTYFVTVTDFYGCQETASVSLTDLYFMSIDLDVIQPTCVDSSLSSDPGSIDLTITNGQPDFTIEWNTGATSEDLEYLYAGSYSVTVTDDYGCELSDTVEISQPILLINFDVLGQGCDGDIDTIYHLNNGQIIATVSGGTGPYTYNWSNTETIDSISGLQDFDIYYLTVTDAYGCIGYDSTIVLSEQFIDLPVGWSIWSTYIDLSQENVSNYFENNGLASEIIIMKNGDGWVYWPLYNINVIGHFNISDGYQIRMSSAQTLHVEGQLICPEDVQIFLPATWSIISYLRLEPMSVVTVFSSVVSSVDIVKNGDGLVYWPLWGLNAIGDMQPGEGYQVKMMSGEYLNYQANTSLLGTKSTSTLKSQQSYTSFPCSSELKTDKFMIVGIPLESWDILPQVGDEIHVYGEHGQLVGCTQFDGEFTPVVLYGDDMSTLLVEEGLADGEDFTISVAPQGVKAIRTFNVEKWQRGDSNFYDGKISVVGVKESIALDSTEADGLMIELYPNPGTGIFYLKVYSLLEGIGAIEVFNSNAQLVHKTETIHLQEGWQHFEIDLSKLPEGAYNLRVISNQTIGHEKLLIIK